MRSPIGPILVVLGLATTIVLTLLLFQVLGLRQELDRTRDEVATLTAQAQAQPSSEPVTLTELEERLDALEGELRSAITSSGGSAGDDGSSGSVDGALADRIDEVLERITALNDRVDEICEGVPVC